MCGTVGPSAPPIDVTADGASTTITVQWGSVPCIHQNGAITGYSVQYGVEGSGNTQTLIFTGNGAEISGIVTSTNYTVQVAAITSAGVGEYSDPPLIVNTESMFYCSFTTTFYITFSLHSCNCFDHSCCYH